MKSLTTQLEEIIIKHDNAMLGIPIEEALLSLFKEEMLKCLPLYKVCGGDLQMNDEYEQCKGFNDAIAQTREKIERMLEE